MNKIFVIEGTDGSGKQTQTELLYSRLKENGHLVLKSSFPNYDNLSSGPVKEYLSGNISKNPNDISPKAASLFYAVDRYISFKENIEKYYLDEKTIILFDRYVSSNLLHQGAKIYKDNNKEKLDDFANWLYDIEYKDLELPMPSITFFLHMPVKYSLELMEKRKNKFSNDDKKDIHELSKDHLELAASSGLYFANKLGWSVIECVKDGKIRTTQDINNEIYSIVKKNLN